MELDPRVSDANFTDPSQSQSLSNLNQLFFVSGKAGHLIYTYIYIYIMYIHMHIVTMGGDVDSQHVQVGTFLDICAKRYLDSGWRCRTVIRRALIQYAVVPSGPLDIYLNIYIYIFDKHLA